MENSKLRENARYQLGGSIFSNDWLMMLAVCAVYSLISSVISTLTSSEEEGFQVVELIGSVVSTVIAGPFAYGICRAATKCVKNQKVSFSDTFVGFKEDFKGSFFVGFLTSLFTFLWALLLIVPGIVKGYSYAMAQYIKQDDPVKDGEAVSYIDRSKEMMEGYKWKLFCLDLSFLGWYIVGALCLGIGVFFVTPYHQVARANFYEALKAEQGISYSTPIEA